MNQTPIADIHVPLPKCAFKEMVSFVRTLHKLSQIPAYRALVYPQVPEVAKFDPGHGAVMMGYDFHVTVDGPRLIEVNTNAGGGMLALRAAMPNPGPLPASIPKRLRAKILRSFADEFVAYKEGRQSKPGLIAIIDENPSSQFLYEEMQAYAKLLQETWAVPTEIADPAQFRFAPTGVYLGGKQVDLIYNRHCDFYLLTPALSELRTAYLRKTVCLSPNPHMYGLLADKRRLALWSDDRQMAVLGLKSADLKLLKKVIPEAVMLADCTAEKAWETRKGAVFKPTQRYGSKGVLVGAKITRKRFEQLPKHDTLMQEFVAPNSIEVPGYGSMKTEFRLFAYLDRILGVTARLYQGQVTNMSTPGGGFARVKIE